jgi:hypothetical protein
MVAQRLRATLLVTMAAIPLHLALRLLVVVVVLVILVLVIPADQVEAIPLLR